MPKRSDSLTKSKSVLMDGGLSASVMAWVASRLQDFSPVTVALWRALLREEREYGPNKGPIYTALAREMWIMEEEKISRRAK